MRKSISEYFDLRRSSYTRNQKESLQSSAFNNSKQNNSTEIECDQIEGFNIFDSTILLTSRAIGIGFLFFPAFLEWQTFTTCNIPHLIVISYGSLSFQLCSRNILIENHSEN